MAVAWVGMWACRVALGWLLGVVWGWGLLGVWLGMFADWGVRAALYRRRFLGGGWLQQHGRW
jgi:Na+-driven multidrug efflux pump